MERGLRKRWNIPERHRDAEHLASRLGVHALIGQVLIGREIADAETARAFLEPSLRNLEDPKTLSGAEVAAVRICHALREREPVILYGDYDVDGITAVAILYHALKTALPDADVRRYIPHRIQEGYGLNTNAIHRLADEGAKLIVTVDCGISAIEPAQAARSRNVDLIVTDHHELGETLPEAFAIVHPALDSSGSVSPHHVLCGASVAYKLAWQIAKTWCDSEQVSEEFRNLLLDLLSLAAMATIADVVPLVGENRTIVHFGLGRIKNTPFEGLQALINASHLPEGKMDTYRVGYILGPRLNACGRMGHAKKACLLLTSATGQEAKEIAQFLNDENDRRRTEEKRILGQAKTRVKEMGLDKEEARAILLCDGQWHPGVLGIVCSRLVETYGKPAILLNMQEERAKGSARSIEGFNIYQALSACGHLLESFGGHAMAAGLEVKSDNLAAFKEALLTYAETHIQAEQLTPLARLDGEATLEELDLETIHELNRLAPFGRGNPVPCFLLRDVTLVQSPNPLGRNSQHMAMRVKQGNRQARCLGWNMTDLMPHLANGQNIDLACRPKINAWQGNMTVELEIEDLKPKP